MVQRAGTKPLPAEDTIEAERLQEWQEAAAKQEKDDGAGIAAFEPGSFGHHEALHTAWLALDLVARHLTDHPAVLRDPVYYRHARLAHEHLFRLYQELGAGQPEGAASRRHSRSA